MFPVLSFRSLCRAALTTVAFVLAVSSVARAQSATLAWNANSESDLAGYRVQYGTVSGSPTTTVDVGNVTQRQFTGLQAGLTYYFRVIAYNTSNMASAPSTEVSHTVPPPPPGPPTLTVVSPASGPTTGGSTITLTGTNFGAGASVTVGGAAATNVVVASATSITARTPAGTAGARDVRISMASGSATLSGAFTYVVGAPALTAISPSSGPAAGGTNVTLTGSNFLAGSTVTIGGAAATNVVVVSGTTITARTPAGTAGARDVRVTTSSGNATLTGGFTYGAAAPTLTGISPASGPAGGGTTVTLTGTGFIAGATVTIGGTAATNVVVANATSISARTPAGTAGARDVRVTTSSGSATLAGAFTYTAPPPTSPDLTSVSPTSGPMAGGTTITLTGTNFSATGLTVQVGGAAATGVTLLSSTSVRAVTPASSSTGARDVRITTSAGTDLIANAFTYTGSTTDSDGDGLPNDWETLYGLNPNSATGVDGGSGDPDNDGLTNAAERTAGSHPRGTHKRYLAEGVSNSFFSTRFAIANPQTAVARVLLTFVDTAGRTTRHYVSVPARTRATVDTGEIGELDGANFATTLEADNVVVLDRLMSWTGRTGYAAHMETAVERPSTTWYLAEGATHGYFEVFYLVQNPSTTAANLRVRYLRPSGAPIVKNYTVGAGSRFTIWVDQEDPALAATDVSAEITSTNGVPVIVERSMYLNISTKAFKGGHNSAGITAAANSWFLAEGSTGGFFSMYVLVANPNASASSLRVTYLRASGAPIVKTYSIAANSRRTIDVAREDPGLADTPLSVKVESTNSVPVIVERTMWWPGSKKMWTEGHNAFGTTRTAPRWVLAEGELGGRAAISTFVLIANTSAAAANVRLTLLPESGAAQTATYTVGANRRFTVPVSTAFPDADGTRFSILVESLNPSTAGALVVERATYWNTDEDVWGAGANAVGAIIP